MLKLGRTIPCRGCGQPIAMIKTEKGKTMPVNPEAVAFLPEEKGPEVFLTLEGKTERGKRVDESEPVAWHVGYVSHFATCGSAADFRRRKTKSERTRGETK